MILVAVIFVISVTGLYYAQDQRAEALGSKASELMSRNRTLRFLDLKEKLGEPHSIDVSDYSTCWSYCAHANAWRFCGEPSSGTIADARSYAAHPPKLSFVQFLRTGCYFAFDQ